MNPLDYVARGWSIFPCHSVVDGRCTCGKPSCRNAGKHPRTFNGVKDATQDPGLIQRWQAMWGDAINWALACGEVSGVLAIDVDPRHTGDASLEAWQVENGALPPTLTSLTGGGGFHLLFRHPQDGQPVSNRTNVLPGVDVRSTGGYVLLPPARHISGATYAWQDEFSVIAALPLNFLIVVRAASEPKARSGAARNFQHMREGERNDQLFRKACSLRRLLHDDRLAVEAAIRAYNLFLCEPPLDEAEVVKIIDSAFKQEHDEDLTEPESEGLRHLTDDGNALRLIDHYGADLRYVPTWGWLRWSGRTWRRDEDGVSIQDRARVIHDVIRQEASIIANPVSVLRWAHQSEAGARINAMVSLARSDTRIARSHEHFDADDLLVSCLNGVLDLRTGELRDHDQTDMITLSTNVEYNPDARLDEWDRFVLHACDEDQSLVDYLQRAVGYSLTGSTIEEAIFIITGPAASGKSTFIAGLQAAFGSYADTFASDTLLMRGQASRRDSELARVVGKRLVSVVEMPEGERLDESVVKQLTGGDVVTARFLYRNPFVYKPKFKLWIATNYEPRISDQAVWRRVKKVPFPRTIPAAKRDQHLKELISDPLQGGRAVLSWAVRGYKMWAEQRLNQPERVTREVMDYYQDQDRMGLFVSESLVEEQGAHVEATEVYGRYIIWCAMVGERPLSLYGFVTRMRDRPGVGRVRMDEKLYITGFKIKHGSVSGSSPWM